VIFCGVIVLLPKTFKHSKVTFRPIRKKNVAVYIELYTEIQHFFHDLTFTLQQEKHDKLLQQW